MQHPSRLILNIGLAIGNTGQSLTLAQVVQALERTGFAIRALTVVTSDTEPTAVVEVAGASSWGVDPAQAQALHWVAVVLAQDAIAAFEPVRGHGVLVGPDAAAWGAFDPSQFWTLAGRRLSPPPAPAHAWASATRDQSEDRRQPWTLAELAALAGGRA